MQVFATKIAKAANRKTGWLDYHGQASLFLCRKDGYQLRLRAAALL
jgi:hypothetical protein